MPGDDSSKPSAAEAHLIFAGASLLSNGACGLGGQCSTFVRFQVVTEHASRGQQGVRRSQTDGAQNCCDEHSANEKKLISEL